MKTKDVTNPEDDEVLLEAIAALRSASKSTRPGVRKAPWQVAVLRGLLPVDVDEKCWTEWKSSLMDALTGRWQDGIEIPQEDLEGHDISSGDKLTHSLKLADTAFLRMSAQMVEAGTASWTWKDGRLYLVPAKVTSQG